MPAAAQWSDRIRRRLKLRDVDILLTVIQQGSMGKAANALNMSQPAVSKAISYLEQTLGVRLLDRSRQGVEPTPYGRALIKRGVAVFDELRQGVQDIAFLTDPAAGEIRAGGSDHVISAIFSPVVHRLSARYPRISFQIAVGDLSTLYRELDARHIDVVVSRLYGPPPGEHSVEVLFEDPLVAVTGAKNPLTRRRKIDISELLDERWTLQPSSNNFGSFAMNTFRAQGLAPPQITVATTSYNLRSEFQSLPHDGPSVLGPAVQAPIAQDSARGIPEYATQGCDHHPEESVAESHHGAFHRRCARHYEAAGKAEIARLAIRPIAPTGAVR